MVVCWLWFFFFFFFVIAPTARTVSFDEKFKSLESFISTYYWHFSKVMNLKSNVKVVRILIANCAV